MIDSGAAVNIMSADVMKEVGLKVDTPYGKCYAMDNRSVPVVGIIKNIEFRFPSFPHISYRTDITVVEISACYGMLLSRQWSNLVGGHVQLDMSYATIPVGGKEIRIEREPQSYYLVEDYILDPAVNFCHSDMDNFQVSITKPTSKIVDPISIYAKENCNDIWQMFFDGACSKEGNGAGIIFVSPSGKTFKFSFLLNFECTNNIAEYEALIIGLSIVKTYGIKMLTVLGDSDLIVSQIRHKFSTRNPRLKQYRNYVWDLLEFFDAFSIKWVDRSINYLADIMANLAVRQIDIPFDEVIQVEMKNRPSIPDNVQNWQVFEDDKDIIRFLTCQEDYECQFID